MRCKGNSIFPNIQYLCRNFFYNHMKILGMGNALVDVLVRLNDDNILNELELPKGSMQLINADKREKIFKKINGMSIQLASGGSASNTLLALAKMGIDSGFIGKVGSDEYGSFYIREIKEAGVTPHFFSEKAPSGTAMTLISPDGERTFGTYLGAAAELTATELQIELFNPYNYFYIEGYLVQNYELIESAIKMAKHLGCTIALDLASYNIVDENRAFLSQLIKDYVDIVFANEEEAKALTGQKAEEAVKTLAAQTQIAVVKIGSEGSLVMKGDHLIHVPAIQTQIVDATAAGDFYSAGFFYGMAHQADLEKCAQIGSLLASNVIKVVGTKLSEECWNEIRIKAKQILN